MTAQHRSGPWALAMLALGMMLAAGSLQVQAQTLYRIVAPDGRVTFTDRPPGPGQTATATTAGARSQGTDNAALPFELRQVVARYPVTLYSAGSCEPCASGRNLLVGRGIPFTERTVSTPEDTEALQRISGDGTLPFLTIGAQQLKGFSDSEWGQFLDAAGYPRSSQLPAGYRQAAAAPLTTVQKPAAAASAPREDAQAAAARAAAQQRNTAPPPPPPANPGGIVF